MPKVSVIIPNYNHARYLDQRIQSVLNQTYQDFEVIFLDDASTDNSNEVVAKYVDDPRFSAVYNQVNSGSPFKQWNRGVREAQGEYIWIAESDDYADATLLEELVERLDSYPQAGIAYCQSWQVDADDNPLRSVPMPAIYVDGVGWKWWRYPSGRGYWTLEVQQMDGGDRQWWQWRGEKGTDTMESANGTEDGRWQQDFVADGKEECRQYLFSHNSIPNASSALFRRALYERVGGDDETLRLCGDWMLWAKLALISDIAFVAKPLNYFRSHANTARSKNVRGGTYVKELYQVPAFLAHRVDVPRDVFEKTCDTLAQQWVGSIKSAKIPWKRNLEIYDIAKSLDPKINRRLLTATARYLYTVVRRRLVTLASRMQKDARSAGRS